MKLEIYLNPIEFRAMLPQELQKLFDSLVNNMVRFGYDKKDMECFVAREILKVIKHERIKSPG